MLKKLTSRKFAAAILGTAVGIAMIFGLDEETAVSIAGAALILASILSYIVVEGKVDKEAVLQAVENMKDASKELLEEKSEGLEK